MPSERKRTRAVLLDRDGVINYDSDEYIKSADEWLPIPGSPEAIARLNRSGYRVAVVTNQAGLARGLFTQHALDAIHERMAVILSTAGAHIDAIVYCPHAPDAQCQCRKPKPGLLQQIASMWDLDLRGVPFVGDSLADVMAATAVGARPVLVRTGKGNATISDARCPPGIAVFADLAAVVSALLEEDASERPSSS